MDTESVELVYRRLARISPDGTHTDRCRFIADCSDLSFERVHELTLDVDIDPREVLWPRAPE